jgi:predicted NAD/FAD-binding protein
MAPTREHRRKVAIIGSGCAGLGAAWALRNTDYEVHVFEKSHKLGGHTNTQPFHAGGTTVQVDTGFIVMNAATYPNFLNFLKEVGVDPVDSEMTFAVSRDNGAFEWSGEAKGIFAQRRNLFRLRHWRMIFDIIRFNQFALDLLADDDEGIVTRLGTSVSGRKHSRDMTIGQYLEKEGYSRAFRDDYLIPMTAAVWSTSPDKTSLEFPAHTLVRFMWNHHLLSTLAVRPPWLATLHRRHHQRLPGRQTTPAHIVRSDQHRTSIDDGRDWSYCLLDRQQIRSNRGRHVLPCYHGNTW